MSKKLFLAAGLGLILSAVAANAGPITTPPVTLSAFGDVTAIYVFADAGDTSILNELTPVGITQIFCNHSSGSCTASSSGATSPLGVQAGPMVFSLDNKSSGKTYTSNGADSDGNYHAKITSDFSDFGVGSLPSGANSVISAFLSGGTSVTYVGFEDRNLAEGSDWDYNDLIFAFANTTTSVPEPLTLSLFGAGVAGAAWMGRRRKAKA